MLRSKPWQLERRWLESKQLLSPYTATAPAWKWTQRMLACSLNLNKDALF